ncbi:MAG: hypothetical protein MJA27_36495 [Pseudanabaenales cyanobacterium]|nr:hypothetical protein [Pseudanabaenales cyanobacterium]
MRNISLSFSLQGFKSENEVYFSRNGAAASIGDAQVDIEKPTTLNKLTLERVAKTRWRM